MGGDVVGSTVTSLASVFGTGSQQWMVALDLEGVLLPEFWVAVAEETGIDDLKRTTKDEPDYDALMDFRLNILAEADIRMSDLTDVIADLEPLPGARQFVDEVRRLAPFVILSDTYEQFAAPLLDKLGLPTVLCHRLDISEEDVVRSYTLRQPDQKRQAVAAFRGLGYQVVAAGDSLNDLTMLCEADKGFFINARPSLAAEYPQFPVADNLDDLLACLQRVVLA